MGTQYVVLNLSLLVTLHTDGWPLILTSLVSRLFFFKFFLFF